MPRFSEDFSSPWWSWRSSIILSRTYSIGMISYFSLPSYFRSDLSSWGSNSGKKSAWSSCFISSRWEWRYLRHIRRSDHGVIQRLPYSASWEFHCLRDLCIQRLGATLLECGGFSDSVIHHIRIEWQPYSSHSRSMWTFSHITLSWIFATLYSLWPYFSSEKLRSTFDPTKPTIRWIWHFDFFSFLYLYG